MITQQDLQEAIAECKGQRNPTASTCMKLAAYYTISDHMQREQQTQVEPTPGISGPRSYSFAPSPSHGSEFLEAAGRLDPDVVTGIMDELMETLRAIHPRLYDGVMAKLTL